MIGVCGEALIDFVPLDVNGDSVYAPRPGGSPCNVAVGLARLGKPAAFISKISNDRFGDLLHSHLAQNGVDMRWLVRGNEPSALAFVIPGGSSGHDFAFYGSGTAEQSLIAAEVPDSFADGVTALHFGSYSLLLGSSAKTYGELMRREHSSRVIALDPNVRPALFADRKLYRRRIEDLLCFATLIKASEDDIRWLYPDERVANVAARWREMGPSVIVVTLGAGGAIGLAGDTVVSSPGVRVNVADTVGAGDAFMSATLAWLDDRKLLNRDALAEFNEDALVDILAYANRAAAVACTKPGADPPRRRQLAELIHKQGL